MAINSSASYLRKKPSHRGLTFLSSLILCFIAILAQPGIAKAQHQPYTIFENEEAKLIFLRPQRLDADNHKATIQSDFTVIIKKADLPDSVRMNFTISFVTPVMNWNFVSLKMKDTIYKFFNPSKIYQEKKHNEWDNRFEIMIPIASFQKFIAAPNDAQFIFSFDDVVLNATFDKKQLKNLADFALQVQLDLKR